MSDTIYSEKFLTIGKKCYIDCMVGLDKDGKEYRQFHFRMKGITEAGLEECCNREFQGDYTKMYEHLIHRELTFILNPECSEYTEGKVSFQYLKDGVVTRENNVFTRKVGSH